MTAQAGDFLCGVCRVEGYDFDLARSYGLYRYPLRDFILELKFGRRERWGSALGELLVPVWQSVAAGLEGPPPLLAPVPLHPSRERERGFNQAELLARGLRHKLRKLGGVNLPRLEKHCLKRIQPAPPQSGLNPRARRENVRGAFTVSAPERVRGRCVLVIDDVMTTGATASACARALKKAGAGRVLILTLARATPQYPDSVVSPAPPRPVLGNADSG